MPFFQYTQNNSGGSFDMSQDVAHFVIVEASSANVANAIAEDKGLYFNGCNAHRDCPCCGDRWYAQWSDNDGESTPLVYGEPLSEYECLWTPPGEPYCIIYYLNGNVERILQPEGKGRYAKKK